jgi:hypothetical protein
MNGCQKVIEMYRDPDRRHLVIDPEEEFRRYKAWLASPEGQALAQVEKDERDRAYRAEFEGRLARERERFGGRDQVAVGSS